MTPFPPESRYELEVKLDRNKDHIVVCIYDKQIQGWAYGKRIYPPTWWDKLLGRTWEDKVWKAIQKMRVKLDKLRKEAKELNTLADKAEKVINQMGVNLDKDD